MPPVSEVRHISSKKWFAFLLLGALVLLVVCLWLQLEKRSSVAPVEELPQSIATSTTATFSEGIFGYSVQGRPLEIYTFSNATSSPAARVMFVGGIHGGYEWNSVALAYQAIEYFKTTPPPAGVTVEIIPNLNPDGLAVVTTSTIPTKTNVTPDYAAGLGRFNANDVDLNRNFDCKWQEESSWRGQTVSAGTSAFSEPEAAALRDVVGGITDPVLVVFWHSQAGNVYASECENGVLPATTDFMNLYATAGDYGAVATFDAYTVTGDAEGWLASLGIPAITVELETRDSTEWERNLAGINAVLARVASSTAE